MIGLKKGLGGSIGMVHLRFQKLLLLVLEVNTLAIVIVRMTSFVGDNEVFICHINRSSVLIHGLVTGRTS
jgi:hypothetical protein